jgi:hypothetical protein
MKICGRNLASALTPYKRASCWAPEQVLDAVKQGKATCICREWNSSRAALHRLRYSGNLKFQLCDCTAMFIAAPFWHRQCSVQIELNKPPGNRSNSRRASRISLTAVARCVCHVLRYDVVRTGGEVPPVQRSGRTPCSLKRWNMSMYWTL